LARVKQGTLVLVVKYLIESRPTADVNTKIKVVSKKNMN